jgi:outer membrane protein W
VVLTICVTMKSIKGKPFNDTRSIKMKRLNKKAKNIITVLSLMALSPMALGQQDDYLLNDSEDILNSEQIDVDGQFKRKASAADRIAKMRKKLEEENEQMVQKKIENIRVKQEQQLSGKLKKAFSGNLDAQDSTPMAQAAPMRQQAPAPVAEVSSDEKQNKIIPFMGVRQYNSDKIDSFESNFTGGLSFDNMVTERISVGLGFEYTTMDIVDRNQFNNFNNFATYVNGEDQIRYKNFNLNIASKFFFSVDSKVRPYAGLGLGYNRTSLRYTEKQSQFVNTGFGAPVQQDNDTSASTSNVNGMVVVGAEVVFTDTIGMVLDFRWNRSLTSGFDEETNNNNSFNFQTQEDLDKQVLRRVGAALEDSDAASLNLGLVVKF